MPRIVALGTAVPPFCFDQKEIQHSARQHFSKNLIETERLLSVFNSVQVRRRFFCVPLEWFNHDHSFSEKNQEYIRWAERLSLEAIERCLCQAGVSPDDVDHLVFISSSGMSTPSIDARIMNRLDMNQNTRRTPIFGLGCAGGAVGLARCCDLAKGAPEQRILLVATELSSLTFQSEDYDKSNFIASALFSDGAAAALVCGDACPQTGIELLDSLSTLWPETLDVMGWDFSETGLSVVFSRNIPNLINKHVRSNIAQFLRRNQISMEDLIHYAIHPGGAKILSGLQKSLGLEEGKLESSAFVLKNYGNMSSATVLFILEHLLRESFPGKGDYGLCAAFGPGFSSELVLLRW